MIVDYFQSLNNDINEGLSNDMIPMGFERLSFHVGLRKATCYLIGGYTGSGKTALVDDAFVLNPADFVMSDKNTSRLKLKIFYFSMERRINYKLGKWLSKKIFIETGQIVSVNKILGWVSKEYKLTKDEHDLVISYKDYINNLLNNIVTIIDLPINPMGIKKVIDDYANKNGVWHKTNEHNRTYTPNNPNELVLIIKDHIGLMKKEVRTKDGEKIKLHTKKDIIDQSCEDDLKFRDAYGYSIVDISQFNRSIANPIRIKNGDVEPMIEDFKETGNASEMADVILSLFDPMRYKVDDPSGYNLNKLRNQNGAKMYRNLKILKNSFGADDARIGLAMQPVIGMYKEMPKISETTEQNYQDIISNKYFNQFERKRLIPMEKALEKPIIEDFLT